MVSRTPPTGTILLGSGGFRTPERIDLLVHEMRAAFGDVDSFAFIPHALDDHDAYVRSIESRGLAAGYRIDSVHRHADPAQALERHQAVFVGGGNTFRLLRELYARGLLGAIRRLLDRGGAFLGVSAGCNIACPTIQTTNDMPITTPPSMQGLSLVPFQINPHYFPGATWRQEGERLIEHFGETRDQRIAEFHEENETPVVGLPEGALLRIQAGEATLLGGSARVFHRGRTPVDLAEGARFLLQRLPGTSDPGIASADAGAGSAPDSNATAGIVR
jgi:dipeptidase E